MPFRKISLLFAVFFASFLTAQSSDKPTKLPIPEGYPLAQLQKLKQRNAAIRSQMGSGHFAMVQSVIVKLQVWSPTELPLKVAFLGGSNELRAQIADAVQAWTAGTGVRFDFGPTGTYREWTRQDTAYAAPIRIAFDEPGYWSWIGAQSIDPSLATANEASMNFQGFTDGLPVDWQGVVRHEFGHAIGFAHEHQSPAGGCDQQFRWNDDAGYVRTTDIYGQFIQDSSNRRPGIYTVLEGPPNNWTEDQVTTNLKQLPATTDIRYSQFDPLSVMMYSFPDWMFVTDNSPCHINENLTPSALDLQAAAASYLPPTSGTTSVPASTLTDALKLLKTNKLPNEVQLMVRHRVDVLASK